MPLEAFIIESFKAAVTNALVSLGASGVQSGLRALNKQLSRGKLDPNHHIARAARLSQLNAAIVATKHARNTARDRALAADPACRAAGRGADPSVTKQYDKALRALNGAIPKIDREIATATEGDDATNAYAEVDHALSRLLAVEQGNPVDETNAALCAATLAEVTGLGGWGAAPDALTEAFESDFNNAFTASLGAILKKDDDVFRIWLVLKQQGTDETLQQILEGLADLSTHRAERDKVALALAKNAEALERVEDQLASLSGLAISNLEETIRVKETSTETNKDVKEVLGTVTEILGLLRLFPPQAPTAQQPMAAVPLAHPPIYNVTGTPNRLFTGRETILTVLDKNIRAGTKTAITAVQGMGGIGKTSLAREYVFEHATPDRFAGVWWVPAETTASILAAYEALAKTLAESHGANLVADNQQQTATNTVNWLAAQPAAHPFLIVLDNAPSDREVKDYIPRGTTKVIITTRDQNFSTQIAEPLSLDLWDEDTTFAFLKERIGLREDRDEETAAELRALAHELGGLPLAAEQAGAYLSQNRWITAGEYTARLVENLNHGASTPLDYDKTVYATFSLALDAILEQADGEAAQGLVNLIAWLSPDGVDLELLQAAATHPDLIPEPLRSTLANLTQSVELLSALQRYSLLSVQTSGATAGLFVYRLIGAIARDRHRGSSTPIWRDAAIMLIRAPFPNDVTTDPSTWPLAGVLTRYAMRLAILLPADQLPEDWKMARALASLSYAAGAYLKVRGNYEGALTLFNHSLTLRDGTCKEEPLANSTVLNGIAGILSKRPERRDDAKTYYKRALEIDAHHLSANDHRLAVTLSNLGNLKWQQKKYKDAVQLTERAAEIERSSIGEGSLEYAISLSNLGSVYGQW
ncbi:MAG: NB-ARC domain-containing protein [Pseudomonadota bacterium]